MKQMLMILVVGVTLFGISGGVSWYLQRQQPKDAKSGEAAPSLDRPLAKASLGGGSLALVTEGKDSPAGPRPAPTTSPEQLAQLATNIGKQQEALKSREQTLLVRQKHLELIHQDLKDERKKLDELRLQIGEELKALNEKIDALERKAGDMDKEKKKLSDKAEEIKQGLVEIDSVEQKRVRQMAAMYDTMEAETAAGILQEMADTGKMDMAVKILSSMQERQSARVLAQMEDRATVVQILDRLRSLKKASTGP